MISRWFFAALFGLFAGAAALGATSGPAKAAGACLDMPLVFEDETLTGCPDEATLARVMNARMAVGPVGTDGKRKGVVLTHPSDSTNKQFVTTCNAYVRALAAGWYAATQAQMNVEGYMRVACGTLLALRDSSKALHSRLADENVGLEVLSLLPPGVLPAMGPDAERALADKTAEGVSVGEMVAVGEVLTRPSDPGMLDLAYRGGAANLGTVAHGDFNGDGWEDLLVYSRIAALEGTQRWYELFALSYTPDGATYTRFDPDGVSVLAPRG